MKIKINCAAISLLVWLSLISLISAGTTYAVGVYTWTGAAGNSQLQNTNNWSPLTAGRPSSGLNDTLQWNGTEAGNLILTNHLVANFDANPGFYMRVAAGRPVPDPG